MERVTDDTLKEFIEEYKDLIVDPTHYPRIFEFMLKSFLYQKGYLVEESPN